MPIDGTGTDEELTGPQFSKKDFEAELMAGCSTIALVSLVTYLVTVWPFFKFPEYSIVGLVSIVSTGILPAMVIGVIVSRKFALAGAAGFFGGSMAGAVFMHLRLQQTLLGKYAQDMPRPDYPDIVAWIIPFAWFSVAGIIAWIFCRREGPEA